MKKYDIEVVTVSNETISVYAKSKEEAIEKVFEHKCLEYLEDANDFFNETYLRLLDNDLEEVK